MPSYASLLAVALSAVTLSSANPLESRRHHCKPRFDGATVSVVQPGKVLEAHWHGAHSEILSPPDWQSGVNAPNKGWRFEETGSYKPSYFIKDVADTSNGLVIAVRGDKLKLENQKWGDNAQIWEISCNSCESHHGQIAHGCTILDKATHRCVTAGSGSWGPVHLRKCNGGHKQKWNFIKKKGGDEWEHKEENDDDEDDDEDDNEEH